MVSTHVTRPEAMKMATGGWNDSGLSSREYLIYAVCFAVIPGVNALVSSYLYYHWRKTKPRRAEQINRLGWRVLFFQLLIYFIVRIAGQ
jgi:hypothetical protein